MKLYCTVEGFIPEGRKEEEVQTEAETLKEEARSSLEGRKAEKKPPPARRKRGKLS